MDLGRKLRNIIFNSVLSAAVGGLVALVPFAAGAQEFPAGPITIVSHTGPGSSTDVFARELARNAEPILGQPIVVANREGGAGAAQMSYLKAAKPDGYTIGVNTLSHLTAWQSNLKGSFDWDDFSWIALAQIDPYVVVVRTDSDFQTLDELVAAAKSGRQLNVGGFGTAGSAHHIAFSLFAEAAGIQFNWIPFDGGPQAMTALLGGHLDVVNTNPAPMLQFFEAGRVRPLALHAAKRLDAMPDLKTYTELGYDVDPEWQQIRGIFGPPEMSEEVMKTLSDAFLKAMHSENFVRYMKTTGQVAGDRGPAEYREFIKAQSVLAGDWLAQLAANR